MALLSIDPDTFVARVQPLLEKRDMPGLLAMLKSNWSKEQIVSLLSGRHCDARKVAAQALSLVGCKGCIPEIAKQLKDPDPMVNQMAEHALWNIWFRCGSAEANEHLARGTQQINDRAFASAIEHFDEALACDPDFAEAYNQRAIAHFLQEHYRDSIADCQRAVELMPCHFGAWAGLGHCYAHLEELSAAKRSYERALAINPHLECVRESVEQLQRRLERS
jgi:tetratricopeptide (TPR) repeat protein